MYTSKVDNSKSTNSKLVATSKAKTHPPQILSKRQRLPTRTPYTPYLPGACPVILIQQCPTLATGVLLRDFSPVLHHIGLLDHWLPDQPHPL
jgi:hypothetical protein